MGGPPMTEVSTEVLMRGLARELDVSGSGDRSWVEQRAPLTTTPSLDQR